MKALIVFAHPNPKSFNKALLDTVVDELLAKKHEVKVRHLYALDFDPVLTGEDLEQLHAGNAPVDIAEEQEMVSWADTLIVIHPIWWWAAPAILKGWVDRVFSNGFAYKYGPKGPEGLLAGKKALVFTSSGSDENQWKAAGVFEAMDTLLIGGQFKFVGIDVLQHKNFFSVPNVDDAARKAMLEEAKGIVGGL